MTDAHLCEISRLTALRRLDLRDNYQITDRGGTLLQSLTQLRSLSLRGTGVSDAIFTALAVLPHLKDLNVKHCFKISSDRAQAFAEKPGLKLLS